MTVRFAHFVAIGIIATPLAAASGATIYEGFDYAATSRTDNDGAGSTATASAISNTNGGTGWSSSGWNVYSNSTNNATATVVATGLTFSDYAVTGRALKIQPAGSSGNFGVVQRQLNATPVSNGEFWVSFLWQQNGAGSSELAALHLSDGTLSGYSSMNDRWTAPSAKFQMVLDADATNDTSTWRPALVVGNGTLVTGTNISPATRVADGSKTFMTIAKFTNVGSANTAGTMWALTAANYDSIKAGGITEAELDLNNLYKRTNTNATGVAFDSNGFVHFGAHRSTTYTIDEIRFSGSLATVVPEPAALSLVGLAGLALGRRRRA